jgi:GT2 family glycosyltransferase
MNPPFFSIVIPTRDRVSQLTACLQSIAALDYPRDRMEVIVVDDGGVEPLREATSAVPFQLIRITHGGPGQARNAGAARAKGDYLAFTADDCLVDARWLRELADAARRVAGAAVAGTVRHGLPGDPYATASHALTTALTASLKNGGASFFTPNNLAVPADAFREVGGFDAAFDFGAGEDRDFCARWIDRGIAIVEAPQAIVEHRHPLTFGSFLRQHFTYGRGSCLFRQRLRNRGGASRPPEPLRFYATLVQDAGRDSSSLLVVLSQLANACGYARQASSWRR